MKESKLISYIKRKRKNSSQRKFEITAISIPITYNAYGDFDKDGLMYVLKENESTVIEFVKNNPNKPFPLISPLVIRANVGDLITVEFENKTKKQASIHIQGVKYCVSDSDGASVGYNPNTTTSKTRPKINYTWYAEREGTYLFNDMADMTSSNENNTLHGLFGALIVEEVGATWTDPVNGLPLTSGCYADIHLPYKPDFREYVTIFHDETEVYDINGNTPINPETGQHDMTMSINYRSEPMRNRMAECEGCFGEEVSMSSWVFGDPSTPVLRAYVGDPARFRIINVGIKETHVFHLHNHQWQLESNDPKSTIIDSISIAPQQCINMIPLFGAGSLNHCIGDVIWHCHLYPHFMMGMWGLWRILDRLEDGTRKLPDETLQPKLMPLPDREAPLPTDEDHPGFPNFIKGTFSEKAEKPPLGIIGSEFRMPTELEEKNFVENSMPGALYSMPCKDKYPDKVFEITAIQLPLVYNEAGWNDPFGRILVLNEDKEDVLSGKKKAEPLIIRANAGDCIEVRLTNELPLTLGGNEYQLKTTTSEAGFHIHLVKFDTIASDGSANGWCNDASAKPGDILIERFYVDSELRSIFFHDHLFPNAHQQHGLFGALIAEPQGSTYHDVKTGKEINSGTQAIIRSPLNTEFREFVLMVHDFAYLFDKDGVAINPPNFPSSHDDAGVMGINYKCEPLHFRKGDPAYAFSSYVHGDPVTPLLETYAGDPIRIRLLDGAHEEQHAFNLNGLRWHKEPTDIVSPIVDAQTYGISEAFNVEIHEDYKKGDYLYYFGGLDDLWLGLWGILRAHDEKVSHLYPLSDRKLPKERIEELPHKTGNPPPKAELSDFISTKEVKNIKKFKVVAMQHDIVYNSFGDHDPNGLMFVLEGDEKLVKCNKIKPKPLILRANAGDFIEVTLTNHFYKPIPEEHYPQVPVQEEYPASNRVSMHCQLVKYNPLDSDGVSVGYNPDQTIGVRESITYRWYADEELGACLLTGFADIRNHRHRGLFGALIIEPAGSIYQDAKYGNVTSWAVDEQINICAPGLDTFREFVLFMQDGLALHDKDGNHIMPHMVEHEEHELDYEDQGEKGFNYRSERLDNRLKKCKNISKLMNSYVHGDPKTPLFRAYINDPVRIRLLMPADKPRNHCFVLHGHVWRQQCNDPFSDIVASQGPISVGNVLNITLIDGANSFAGDYTYRSGAYRWDVEQGMWGIFRVYDELNDCLAPINGNMEEESNEDDRQYLSCVNSSEQNNYEKDEECSVKDNLKEDKKVKSCDNENSENIFAKIIKLFSKKN